MEVYKLKNNNLLTMNQSVYGTYKISVESLFINDHPFRGEERLNDSLEKTCETFAESILYLKKLQRPLFTSEKASMKQSLSNIIDLHTFLREKESEDKTSQI